MKRKSDLSENQQRKEVQSYQITSSRRNQIRGTVGEVSTICIECRSFEQIVTSRKTITRRYDDGGDDRP